MANSTELTGSTGQQVYHSEWALVGGSLAIVVVLPADLADDVKA